MAKAVKNAHSPADAVAQARATVLDGVGREVAASFPGITRLGGQIVAALYLADRPLSMDELIVTFFTASPSSATLPLRVFGMAKVGLNPMLNALSAIFIMTTIAFVLFSARLRKLSAR